jgi:hypothetical protein
MIGDIGWIRLIIHAPTSRASERHCARAAVTGIIVELLAPMSEYHRTLSYSHWCERADRDGFHGRGTSKEFDNIFQLYEK